MIDLNTVLALTISLLAGGAAFAVVYALTRTGKKELQEEQLADIIDSLTKSEIQEIKDDAGLPAEGTWNSYWFKLYANAGYSTEDPRRLGAIMLFGPLFLIVGLGFMWPAEPILGIALAVITLVGVRAVLQGAATQRIVKIDNQLPHLVAGLRAGLSSSLTPQAAIIEQSKEIPAPLGDELKLLRKDLELGMPFDAALERLSARVPSKELQFMIMGMRTSVSEGADLDKILKTLQEVMGQRASIRNKLSAAIAGAQPALVLVSLAIPVGFLFSYFSNTTNQEFWLSVTGLILLGVVSILYALSLFVTQRQIKKVKES